MPVAAAGRPAAVATLAIVLVGLVMTWDALGLGFTAVLESKGLLLLVAVGFLVALGSFDGEAADVGGRRQLARAQAPAPPARLPDQEPLAQDVTAPSTSRQPVSAWRSGSGELVARSGGSGGALSSLGSASASASGRIKKSSSSLAVVGMTGRSGSSTALVPAADDSAALVEGEGRTVCEPPSCLP